MNFAVFDIEIQINRLINNRTDEEIIDICNDKSNINYLLSVDLSMHDILNKKIVCRELLKLQEDKRYQFNRAFSDAALMLEYLNEAENYLEKIKNQIINKDDKGITLFVLEKLTKHYLSVFKEIYVLSINDCFLGAAGRYRIFLEIYCIFKYFSRYPDVINRFVDHFLIKNYLEKKHHVPNDITPEETDVYNTLRKRYEDEYKTFKQNYGWVFQKLRQPNSIKEVLKLTFNDMEFNYLSTEYNIISEYSHASLNTAMKKSVDINAVFNFLGKSGDFSVAIMRIYIGWIINITGVKDKRLLVLSDFLGRLAKYLYNDYNPKK
jgi:uncharacterized protein YozE (UPF0346 family)